MIRKLISLFFVSQVFILSLSINLEAATCSAIIPSMIPLNDKSVVFDKTIDPPTTIIIVKSLDECIARGVQLIEGKSVPILQYIKNYGFGLRNTITSELEMHYDDETSNYSVVSTLTKKNND